MKKVWVILPLVLLLQGCGAEAAMETISDELIQPVMANPRQISVRLPEDTVAPVLESGQEQVYLCQDYEIVVETLSSGDLNETVQHVSGFEKEKLTLVKTIQDDADRYDFVWVSAGEAGERLGRAVILDDGDYHYCLSVLRDADSKANSQIVWSDVFQSFSLVSY